MVLLNGVPPIIGLGFFHVTVINIFAMIVEYSYIKRRHNIDRLVLRTILANIISLVVGLVVLFLIPELMGGNIAQTNSEMTSLDKMSLLFGLLGLFLANVAIEFPAYIVRRKVDKFIITGTLKSVLVANAISNIPVFFFYGLLAL